MTGRLFIFGLGFTGLRFARAMQLNGWHVAGSVSSQQKADKMHDLRIAAEVFDGTGWTDALEAALKGSTHILSTIPPLQDGNPITDPVLRFWTPKAKDWMGYLSTTGVYGDHQGGWVDETTPVGGGTNAAREAADAAWRAAGEAIIFRLPGIYGPGRSTLDRAENGRLSRIDKPGHVFSRIHVDDIVQTLIASIGKPDPGAIYNVADDVPAPAHEVETYACELLGITPAPLRKIEEAGLSKRALEFYSQVRRVKNEKIKETLGISLLYPTYREGLRGCLAARHMSA
ncbi:MAG: SDR family NAD(P)-dependent oxidoreductase [Pseudomonadota bacterium]